MDSDWTNITDRQLTDPVTRLPGVGKRRAQALARLNIHRVADLIKHLPVRWERQDGHQPIARLLPDARVCVVGEIAACRWVSGRRSQGRFQATVEDESGHLNVVWFNARYLKDKLHPGMQIMLTGKTTEYQGYLQMVNPDWQRVDTDTPALDDTRPLLPIYPATENLPSALIDQFIQQTLPKVITQIKDHLPKDLCRHHRMPTLADAYRLIHAPQDDEQPRLARRRLVYDELLMLQLGIESKRYHNRHRLHAYALHWSAAIDQHIRDRFPFPLTAAQDRVVREIADDLQRHWPMNRLLQGDVGSGKTVVALYAMLMAVADRKQAALMAPTELLAEQHFRNIQQMLHQTEVRIALITGSMPAARRKQLQEQAANGDIDIVIGTQALLTDQLNFAAPAVMIIDEQHRFGVHQRAVLKSKSTDTAQAPHVLVMTATPIPRTLGMTIFGDLDISTIDSLPPGRVPIVTRVVKPAKSTEVYRYALQQVQAGRQVYVVVPAIDEGELDLKTVDQTVEMLNTHYFTEHRVAAVHGRLTGEDREKIMTAFVAGDIHVLVATTVIEVGVDVPNASMMIIEHAERFGLAQLHQLRGRVGRGNHRSVCAMIAEPITEQARQRMQAIAGTTNGFEIAEADLTIRGMGELFGTRQSGLPPLPLVKFPNDLDMLQLARHDARAMIEADPTLSQAEHELLKKRLYKKYGKALGLVDVA